MRGGGGCGTFENENYTNTFFIYTTTIIGIQLLQTPVNMKKYDNIHGSPWHCSCETMRIQKCI